MNRSYSKKRYLLEANLLAEKRFLTKKLVDSVLNEQDDQITSIAGELRKELQLFNSDESKVLGILNKLSNPNDFIKLKDLYKQLYDSELVSVLSRTFSDKNEKNLLNNSLKKFGVVIDYDKKGYPYFKSSVTPQQSTVTQPETIGTIANYDWSKYPCVTSRSDVKQVTLKDGSVAYEITGNYRFYGNGRVENFIKKKKQNFYCKEGGVIGFSDSPAASQPAATPAGANVKQQTSWQDCSKSNTFQFGCKDPRPATENSIKKLQSCLGFQKQDGLFGKNTLTQLNSKFPDLGGVVRMSDLDTICAGQTPKGSAYQAEDSEINPDLDQPQQREIVTPVQQIQRSQTETTSTSSVKAPQLSQQTIQQAGQAAQRNQTLRP